MRLCEDNPKILMTACRRGGRQHLARKLDKYWHFVQSICPSHPGIDLGQPDWAETIVPALFPAVNIRVVGLSTVWVK